MSEKIVIGMPVYNNEETIEAAIESILNQTYRNFTLVISDNSSTDNTRGIIEKYSKIDSRIEFFNQTENIGASENFRFVLNAVPSKLFLWHAGDDTRHPLCLEKYVKNINNAGLCFSSYQTRDLSTDFIRKQKIIELSEKMDRTKSANLFLRFNRPSFWYGLFVREYLLQCIKTLEQQQFDWFDTFLIYKMINRYGANTFNGESLYSAGYNKEYVPKPVSKKYVRPNNCIKELIKENKLIDLNFIIGIIKLFIVSLLVNKDIYITKFREKMQH